MFKKKRFTQKLLSSHIDTGFEAGLVSVVLPVYNGEKYIEKAVESVLLQTWRNLELIIVNDGSTDNTVQAVKKYMADSRVRLINQENQKLPSALNRGFDEAKGEFYTWISADNIMLPDCIEAMAEELRNKPDADMVYGNMYLIDAEGKRITGHGWFEMPPSSGNVILPNTTVLLNTVANNTIGAAFMYRAGAEAVLGGYSKRLYLIEDYDYFMRMNSLFRICHTEKKEPIYAYRIHSGSLTAHDEELGITASRPRLMKFDRKRRKLYRKAVCVSIKGNIPLDLKDVGIFPAKSGRAVLSDETLYNEENAYVIKALSDGRFSVAYGRKTVITDTAEDAALYLRYRIICKLLREEEKKFF